MPKARISSISPAATGEARANHLLAPLHLSVLDEARRAGLLDGEKSEYVSFRAPPALVEAAKRGARVSFTGELGVLALVMLARPDPVAAFFRRTEGKLGPSHDLNY